ncbi:MAG: hypothetical protein JXO51_00280 [Candidatus Aminicenantes bacterium]|nr:hypothetical protein [Candidatus Aminicenantes bacterium]
MRFKSRKCRSTEELLDWERGELELLKKAKRTRTDTDEHRQGETPAFSVPVREGQCSSVSAKSRALLQANAVLSLLNLCCWLLDRQLAAQAAVFEKEGGFTERLYRIRNERRKKS